MALDVSIVREDRLLVVKAHGTATLVELKGLVDRLATTCREERRQFVLADLLEVSQVLTFTEHLQLGMYTAEKLAFLARMATVVPLQARSGNSERAAQKSGLRLRTFTEMAEARAWLGEGTG